MKFLLDTQILLWSAGQPELLSTAACKLLTDPQNELFFSSAHPVEKHQSLGRY